MTVVWQSHPVARIEGTIQVPGDKSISHRSVMLGALAEGETRIRGFLEGEDCLATMRAFAAMGVMVTRHESGELSIQGRGLYGLSAPKQRLDLGNSGTSMRLLAGILAGQSFVSTLTGDASLVKRPMSRIIEPLTRMGAQIETSATGTAPLHIIGHPLQAIEYSLPIASAQLKSALLLAGLYAKGTTILYECGISRDHTERMLAEFGAKVIRTGKTLQITGGQILKATEIDVPSDISSAAFFMVATLIAGQGVVTLTHVGINPTRAAVIEILRAMGGRIEIENMRTTGGEPIADLIIYPSVLRGIDVPESLVSIAIDEFPIIFIAAAYANGVTTARNLQELRVKESDRLGAMYKGLTTVGIRCELKDNDITIYGGKLRGGTIDSLGDHRIAMSFAVAAIGSDAPIIIYDCENVATSFPTFVELSAKVGMELSVSYA